jgi:DNA-binding Lrp family transcriptional regulator
MNGIGCLFGGAVPQPLRREGIVTASSAVDRLDRLILAALQVDGRVTNQALSQAVGLSASACLARVRRLEAEGLIMGYQARVAIERVRATVVIFAEVTLTRHHPADFAAFEAFAMTIPDVIEAAQVSGAFDYLLKVAVGDMLAWRELSDRILNSGLGVDKISSHVMMKAAKDFVGYPIES